MTTKALTPRGRALLSSIEALLLRKVHAPPGENGLTLHEIGRTLDQSENHLRRVLFDSGGDLTSWRISATRRLGEESEAGTTFRASRLALVERLRIHELEKRST